jgi:CRP-like cAMP-binding protein
VIEKHLLKLRARGDVSDEEEAVLRDLVSETKPVAAKTTIIRAGDVLAVSTLLLEGLMCRYKDLRNGQRQITEMHVAGDFVDLHSFALKRLDHNIMALTACRIAIVPHERLTRLTEDHPHLTRMYWFSTNLDAAIHREWELSLGRRSALSRTAQFFCELHVRLGLVGLADRSGYPLGITQIDLAECLGMTAVHINRTLKELREQGVVEFRHGRVAIGDLDELRRVAEFDPAFLYLERRPHR